MNYSNITQAYQNAERQALEETNDPHLIIMTMLDALVKSMQIFVDNIDLKKRRQCRNEIEAFFARNFDHLCASIEP